MQTCDCCGTLTDERSLESVGDYWVCKNCYSNYDSDDELIEELEED